MKIKLDENMPAGLVDILASLSHDVVTVPQEGLRGHRDAAIWDAAQAEGRFLITQDLHFSDIRMFPPGTHHGILLVRLGNPRRRDLAERVRTVFTSQDASIWPGCFAVATQSKLRLYRR